MSSGGIVAVLAIIGIAVLGLGIDPSLGRLALSGAIVVGIMLGVLGTISVMRRML